MNGKRLLGLLLAVMLLLSLVTGCGKQVVVTEKHDDAQQTQTEQREEPAEAAEEPAADHVKTGLSVAASAAKSAGATAEKEGSAQSDITLVAVTVGDDGVIDQCVIDMVQAKVGFDTTGALTTDPTTMAASKNELGADYGMAKASSIGKEWNEQAAALADYVCGKTLDEIEGIALTEKGAPADADLAASVTISIGGFLEGVRDAVENASHMGAQKGDALKLVSVTNLSQSKNASAEDDGLAQAYSNLAAVTLREDTVTSCYIDAVQVDVNFDTAGQITSDVNAAFPTKNTLGDDYGMKKASSIGKEWNEQAAAFCQYVTGKTVSEVAGIAVNEKGAAADVDLASSVTVGIGAFQELIRKAAE